MPSFVDNHDKKGESFGDLLLTRTVDIVIFFTRIQLGDTNSVREAIVRQ
jgi:hypothetical protein